MNQTYKLHAGSRRLDIETRVERHEREILLRALFPLADEGGQHFTYSLFPHPGDWTQGGVVEEAFALSSQLFALPVEPGGGTLAAEWGFVRIEGVKLALGSFKRAEDGRGGILRLYAPHGARGRCALRFALPVQRAEGANLLEESEGPVDVGDGAVRFGVRPFEGVTLRVGFG